MKGLLGTFSNDFQLFRSISWKYNQFFVTYFLFKFFYFSSSFLTLLVWFLNFPILCSLSFIIRFTLDYYFIAVIFYLWSILSFWPLNVRFGRNTQQIITQIRKLSCITLFDVLEFLSIIFCCFHSKFLNCGNFWFVVDLGESLYVLVLANALIELTEMDVLKCNFTSIHSSNALGFQCDRQAAWFFLFYSYKYTVNIGLY